MTGKLVLASLLLSASCLASQSTVTPPSTLLSKS